MAEMQVAEAVVEAEKTNNEEKQVICIWVRDLCCSCVCQGVRARRGAVVFEVK